MTAERSVDVYTMAPMAAEQDQVKTLTAVPGIKVGHAEDRVGMTGCTVVLCEGGAVGGVDQRGGAPGTRETDLLRPMHLVTQVHAVVLAGGSAFGLAAADGVVRYLRERNIGYKAGKVRVPIVPAAILFDLALGSADAFPDAEMGYQAALAASTGPVVEGNVGAGVACSAGKILGPGHATKTGIGSAAIELGAGLVVAALIAVNPFGDVVDEQGRVIAGTRGRDGQFVNTLDDDAICHRAAGAAGGGRHGDRRRSRPTPG